jgi:paired amphipathic helix protein Sin3a
MHHLQDYQNNSSAGKLLFFDRAKKSLENRDVYDDFLKLLNLFSRDIIDVEVLIERAKVFLGDGDLMAEFKDLMGWDDRDKIDKGPPGSIRTGPPELPAALPVDDGEGPSYRKLPPSVRPFNIVVALFMLTSSLLDAGNGFGMFGPR